ncbi:Peroxiredoxin [Sporomusa ovata DSM 2662]|uniref:Uncharacterized protein n=1 Tax=Sporomusa ovata TaxID=2378 RepID=A0A0U1L3V8_9FIRM|nr:hypothetical protein [Sporomusa ovata]EQB25231.1 hypothetical protein SOV_5c03990 [Sporomusa ovata DSM 2662]CQR73793.1 hypothetical protein SpAn4DRAFT_0255 [Sporomusa ovata]
MQAKGCCTKYQLLKNHTSDKDLRQFPIEMMEDVIKPEIAVYPGEVGREINEVLRIAKALQLYDQTQQLEPTGWQPGIDGIQANIQDAGNI